MFTGIIDQVGTVTAASDHDKGRKLTISGEALDDVPIGASLAVNGVCLTAVGASGSGIVVDVIPETLNRTNLGSLGEGDKVNLEQPMRADGRFDGHIVQGHVDGTGVVSSMESDAGGTLLTIDVSGDLLAYMVEKGSITVDGVSLTVTNLTGSGLTVALIPHTLEVTTLGLRKPGDLVNLEVDVLAKYVERLLKANR